MRGARCTPVGAGAGIVMGDECSQHEDANQQGLEVVGAVLEFQAETETYY